MRAPGAIRWYKVVYLAMCFFAAPSQVQMTISSPGTGLDGVYTEVRGPIDTNPVCSDVEVDGARVIMTCLVGNESAEDVGERY